MDARTRPPRQISLTTGGLATGSLRGDLRKAPRATDGARFDGQFSLMDRVFAFLDRYPLAGGSAPLGR